MKENKKYTHFYVIQDPSRKATKKQKEVLRGISYCPIYVGACNGLTENYEQSRTYNSSLHQRLKRFNANGREKVITLFPVRDPEMIVERALTVIKTVDEGGPLMNKAINRVEPPEKKLQYIRNWKTPYGIFKKSSNAIAGLSHPVQLNTFKQWCNFPDKMITTTARNRYPELFDGCLTYGEAGFGRVG